MAVPSQGVGTSTPWVADGSGFDADPYNLPNDGSQWSFATLMVLIARLINSVGALYSGGAMQVPLYVGTSFTMAAGPLLVFLKLLADKVAKLDAASNTFTGAMGVNGALQAGSAVVLGTTDLQGNVICEKALELPTGAYVTRTPGAIPTSTTTQTIDAGHCLWIADAWAGSGGTLAATLAAYDGADFPDVEILFEPTSSASILTLTNAGAGSAMVTLTGKGSVRLRWSGVKWRYMSACAINTDPTNLAFTSP